MSSEMIPATAFQALADELNKRNLRINSGRKNSGKGRSQTFGVVRKRISAPDYSRHCRDRPFLYKLLMEFSAHLPATLAWNSICVNQNYQCLPHKDTLNTGDSLVVAFGNFLGGELVIEGKEYDARHKPVVMNFSQNLHWVKPFTGNRYSMVFYYTDTSFKKTATVLPEPSVRFDELINKYVFFRGEMPVHMKKRKSKKKISVLTKNDNEPGKTLLTDH